MAYPSKRNHSPTNDYDTSTIFPDQPRPHKKVIPDDMFTNQMAAMSLSHQQHGQDDSWKKQTNKHVERVEDMDDYLKENTTSTTSSSTTTTTALDDGDTFLGDTPELVGIRMGTTTLPFERIPGTTTLRIPDFVCHPDRMDREVYELARQQLQNTIPPDQYQPMDLD